MDPLVNDSFLRLPEVINRTGLGRSSIYSRINEGTFPAPIKIGPRAIAFQESKITEWIQDKINGSKQHEGDGI